MRPTATRVLLIRPGWGAEYCNQPVCMWVCLCVCICLSICPRAYLWNRWTNLHQILYAHPRWPWLGPYMAALRYVMYFRFYEWRHVWPYGDSGGAIPGRSLMSIECLVHHLEPAHYHCNAEQAAHRLSRSGNCNMHIFTFFGVRFWLVK